MTKTSVTFRRQLSCSTSAVALLLAGAVIAGMPTAAQAADVNWTGTTSTDWFTPGNWTGTGAAPTTGDNANIDATTPNAATVNGGTASAARVDVGLHNTGALTIQNGGAIADQNAFIGDFANSTGSVTVDGSGSSWATQTQLAVGESGTGSLTVSNGGQVSFLNGEVGDSTGGDGTVRVTTDATINGNGLAIGVSGTGHLNIESGGHVNDVSGTVGGATNSVGIVVVDGSGSSWINTGNAANPVGLFVGQSGSGTLTISNGGLVRVTSSGPMTIADQAGSTGVLNIGAAMGATPVAPGTLDATNVQFGAGDGTINFNHTSANYTFDAEIHSSAIGQGTINQLAGTTILTADSSGFTGHTNISGGALYVNGSLSGSDVTVSGGMLAGTGTVGSINAQAGATIAPGNSVGTLNVVNDVVFSPNSIYQISVNPGQGSTLAVGGAATINGGTVQVLAGAGNYSPTTDYTILTAAGGVTGQFTGVTSNLAFLTPSLTSDANDVYLRLTRNGVSFASVGTTPNQIATGAAVENLASGNAVANAVLGLSAQQADNAFDHLSGEVHASAKTALIEDSRFVRDAAINRLRAAFAAVGASSGPLAAFAADGTPVAATTDGLAFWGQAFGSFGSTDGDGNAAKLSRSTGGFLAGGDAFAFDNVRIGALTGYSRTNFDVKDRSSSGTSDNFHVGVYGGSQWGALGFRSGAAYTLHQIDTSRTVVLPGFGEQLAAAYNAGTAQVFGEFGYRIDVGHTAVGALAFEPFANLAYVNLWTGGFNETGGAAALSGRSGSTDVTYSTLGLRASTGFTLNGMVANARGSLGWRHAAGDITPASLLAFAGGGSSFSILGVPIAQDSAVVEAGFDVLVARDVSVGFAYVGQVASNAQDQDFKANLIWKF